MIQFEETPLDGPLRVVRNPFMDDRGSFTRLFCRRTFEDHGLVSDFAQQNMSHCIESGVLRGLHYQVEPAEEVKLLHCVRGSVFDVIVDMRPESATYLEWYGCTLRADQPTSIYIPGGFAHGYQALEDDSAVVYMASTFYSPEHERCVRYNDPVIGIDWPILPAILSDKDRSTPLLPRGDE